MRRPSVPARPLDLLAAAVILAAAELEALAGGSAENALAVALLMPVAVLPLAWRRHAPLVVLVSVLAGVSVLGAVEPSGEWVVPFASVLVALYSVAAYTDRRRAVIGLALVLLFFASGTVLDNLKDPGRRPLGDLVYMTVLNTSAWATGRIVRRWREQALMLEQRTAELEQERAWREQAAVAEERNRIARELHDVIAHSVSLMVVQAAAAEQMLATDPPRAREPIVRIQESGRQAVSELRRLLGILRPGEEEASLAPQPTLRALPAMVERARDAGLVADVRVEGEARDLAPGVELVAYRLVQEALTNALKHAGPTSAHVVVRYGDDRLDIEVTNEPGRDRNGTSANGTGHGLSGMRERLALYGGALEAGPWEGGFAVRAHIPLTGTPR